ncbi:MAG: hypothetical protein AABY14_02440 [Nanoarchaeota archaeon]
MPYYYFDSCTKENLGEIEVLVRGLGLKAERYLGMILNIHFPYSIK